MQKSLIYFNGEFVTATSKLKESLLPWNLTGRGAFETMLFTNRRIGFLNEHLSRLRKSLNKLGVEVSVSKPKVLSIIRKIAKGKESKRLRLTCWKDGGKSYLSIVSAPLGKVPKSWSICLLKDKLNVRYLSKIKSINYSFFRKAFQSAADRGFDEGIVFNQKNEIVEGSRSNIFLVKDGTILTPSLKSGCLDGITRAKIFEISKKLRIPIKSKSLKRTDLLSANEVFATNSIIGVMPIMKINRRSVLKNVPITLTTVLSKEYNRVLNDNLTSV